MSSVLLLLGLFVSYSVYYQRLRKFRRKTKLLPEPPKIVCSITVEGLRQILEADPLLGQIALKYSGLGHLTPESLLEDWEQLLRAITQIPEMVFQVLHVAATQKEVDIECGRFEEKVPCLYPEADPEPGFYHEPSQFSDIFVEDLALDDDLFYARLATEDVRTLKHYEVRTGRRVMYILLDVSGSMKETFPGRPYARHIWARGVAIKQLIRALRGEASFFLRYFTSCVGCLYRAAAVIEAQAIVDHLFEIDFAYSGTDIQLALETAATDIKQREPLCERAEILLLSDGESPLVPSALKEAFGENVRLHTVLIGEKDSLDLQRLSTTYLKL